MSATAEAYASAFFDVAKAEGALTAVGQELATFARAYESSPELQRTLTDQTLPTDRRQGVIESLLGGKANPVTTNLVSLLVGTGRVRDLPDIVGAMLDKTATEQGKAAGEVRSAHPLTSDQQQALTAALSKTMGKSVELTFLVDPSVVGGVVTKIGDTVIDGSIRNRIEQLKAAV